MTTKINHPIEIDVVEGERYSWCSCGFSQTMPLCDHSHREKSTKKSFKFFAEKNGRILLCGCSETATPPVCDQRGCQKVNNGTGN